MSDSQFHACKCVYVVTQNMRPSEYLCVAAVAEQVHQPTNPPFPKCTHTHTDRRTVTVTYIVNEDLSGFSL